MNLFSKNLHGEWILVQSRGLYFDLNIKSDLGGMSFKEVKAFKVILSRKFSLSYPIKPFFFDLKCLMPFSKTEFKNHSARNGPNPLTKERGAERCG
jgi:hypothetical protein